MGCYDFPTVSGFPALFFANHGSDSWVDIETFGSAKIDRFETFLELPNGIPYRDTFGRVFSLIEAWNFQNIFIEWTKMVWEATQGQIAAIDGETVRRSADKANGKSPIHMASARTTANGVALGQVKTPTIPTRQPPSPNCSKRWKSRVASRR